MPHRRKYSLTRLGEYRRIAFDTEQGAAYELLLVVMLLKCVRDALTTMLSSPKSFHSQDAFSAAAIFVEPVAWAAWLPQSFVLSHAFTRLAAVIVFFSATLWLFKRCLPISPILCALSYGLLQSCWLSRMFNYKHQYFVVEWVLIVFAAVHVLRWRSFHDAKHKFGLYAVPLYPGWVALLIAAYLGFQYSCSGITKLQMAGIDAGSGTKLQLLVWLTNTNVIECGDPGVFVRMIIEHRWLAIVGMTSSVILETGAVFAFSIRGLRPWWALGLVMMHVIVIATMHIPFIPNIIVLAWLATPNIWIESAVDSVRRLLSGPRTPVVPAV